MIVQNISADGTTDLTFTVTEADLDRSFAILDGDAGRSRLRAAGGGPGRGQGLGESASECAATPGVAQTMFAALAEKGINIQVISTSEIKISVLVSEDYTELARARPARGLRTGRP